MDILETQVSDLRSFLTHPAGPGTPVTRPGAAAISPPRHPGSPLSAPGDNSALPSPFASGSGSGFVGAARNGAAAGKRKADGDDGSSKTQRSKRNRVCHSRVHCPLAEAHRASTLLTGLLTVHLDSMVCVTFSTLGLAQFSGRNDLRRLLTLSDDRVVQAC